MVPPRPADLGQQSREIGRSGRPRCDPRCRDFRPFEKLANAPDRDGDPTGKETESRGRGLARRRGAKDHTEIGCGRDAGKVIRLDPLRHDQPIVHTDALRGAAQSIGPVAFPNDHQPSRDANLVGGGDPFEDLLKAFFRGQKPEVHQHQLIGGQIEARPKIGAIDGARVADREPDPPDGDPRVFAAHEPFGPPRVNEGGPGVLEEGPTRRK